MTISDKKAYINKHARFDRFLINDADFIEYFYFLNRYRISHFKLLNTQIDGNLVTIALSGYFCGDTYKIFTGYVPIPVTYKKLVNAIITVLYKLHKYLEG